jgi:hypothetical protein
MGAGVGKLMANVSITCPFAALGIAAGSAVEVVDVFTGGSLGQHTDGYTAVGVQPHDCRFLRLKPTVVSMGVPLAGTGTAKV